MTAIYISRPSFRPSKLITSSSFRLCSSCGIALTELSLFKNLRTILSVKRLVSTFPTQIHSFSKRTLVDSYTKPVNNQIELSASIILLKSFTSITLPTRTVDKVLELTYLDLMMIASSNHLIIPTRSILKFSKDVS